LLQKPVLPLLQVHKILLQAMKKLQLLLKNMVYLLPLRLPTVVVDAV
jgi:hypothetical protein